MDLQGREVTLVKTPDGASRWRDLVTILETIREQAKVLAQNRADAEKELQAELNRFKTADGLKIGAYVYLRSTVKGGARINRDKLLHAGVSLATIEECTEQGTVTKHQLLEVGE
jgi:hypothetical protein